MQTLTKMTETQVATLKQLARLNIDSQEGFEYALSKLPIEATDHRNLFSMLANERCEQAAKLNQLIAKSHNDKIDEGSFLASLHRSILALRDVLSSEWDEYAVFAECERGEDTILKAYNDAIDKGFSGSVRELIMAQCNRVQKAHDQIKAIRDSVQS